MVRIQKNHQEGNVVESSLDALVMLLDLELSASKMLQYRLAVLRLTLVYGDTDFIHLAAGELGDVTMSMTGVEGGREQALAQARSELGAPADASVAALADLADEPHKAVLRRLVNDLQTVGRSVEALRDAVRTSSEDGRRSVRDLLDLTDQPDIDFGGHAGSRSFVAKF